MQPALTALSAIHAAVESAMNEAFLRQLKEIFSVNTTLRYLPGTDWPFASSAALQCLQRKAGQISCRRQSRLFVTLDFASTLQQSDEGLTGIPGADHSQFRWPSCRLIDVREWLMPQQSKWKLLAKTAETELQTCRLAKPAVQQEIQSLAMQATLSLEQSTQSSTEASKAAARKPVWR